MTRCVFLGNYADDEGGAICLVAGSDIHVADSRFYDNEAYFSGGAIYCGNSSPVIINSTLEANSSTIFAGGISGWYDANFHLENVVIRDCVAGTVTGFYCVDSQPVFIGCLITGNLSTLGAGGGGGLTSGSHGRFINTTFADNTAEQTGGAFWVNVSTAEVIGSILWDNIPDAISLVGGSTVDVAYSDIAGGWAGPGNLNLNPEFSGAEPYPYSLGDLSPCIDTGRTRHHRPGTAGARPGRQSADRQRPDRYGRIRVRRDRNRRRPGPGAVDSAGVDLPPESGRLASRAGL